MLTMKMLVCLASLNFPTFPEVCQVTEIERESVQEHCLAVQAAIDRHPDTAEYQAVIVLCDEFDPEDEEHAERLAASNAAMVDMCQLDPATKKCIE